MAVLSNHMAWRANAYPAKPLFKESVLTMSAISAFNSAEKFVVNAEGPVSIASLGRDFTKHLGSKREKPCRARHLYIRTLEVWRYTNSSSVVYIMRSLAESKRETTLGQYYDALADRQDDIRRGFQDLAEKSLVGFVRSAKDELCYVSARWDSAKGGWCIDAEPIDNCERGWFRNGAQFLTK